MQVKQEYTQRLYVFQQACRISLALCFLCINLASGVAQEHLSASHAARVRLIPANEKSHDSYVTGLAVTMDAHSHTYWRVPGDAGVPPVFDFSNSTNVAKAEILYPAPSRISEDGLDAFGYAGQVTFPILVTPADPTKPSILHADVNLAVCGKICIPVTDAAEADLPQRPASDDKALLDKALALVPKPLPDNHRDDLTLVQIAKSPKPVWTMTWYGVAPIDDIFAEAPEGFVFVTKPDAGRKNWILTVGDVAEPPPSKWVSVTLTLAGKSGGYFTTRTLDVSTKSP
ncbi:MAG: protein-disulfide reductase DsbD family protein [Beijerinckiaceae bacterium]|nr:protein-disulfide reductase DsbD family protein [Beijerinckiaceae bacterium]